MVVFFRRIFIVFAALASFPQVFLCAAGMFEDFPVSPRVSAMGGASAALADDASSVRSNPAGMVQCGKTEFESSYTNLYDADGLYLGSLSAVFPSGVYAWGVSWQRLSLTGIYSEDIFSFAFARQFSDSVSLGLSVSDLRSCVSGFESDFYKNDVKAAALDAGVLWQPADDWMLGAVFEKINEPTPSGSSEKLYSRQMAGLKYQPFDGGMAVFEYDFSHREVSAGFEVVVGKILPVRLGVNRGRMTFGIGIDIASGLIGGGGGGIDFAMITDSNLGNLYSGGLKFRL